jgi:aryl-alcohol dehydrogenase-like predicted oxidoreductase
MQRQRAGHIINVSSVAGHKVGKNNAVYVAMECRTASPEADVAERIGQFYEESRFAHPHGKSAAQVMLRWHLQEGRSAIPKSTKPARIAENFNVFDFELTIGALAAIDALDTGVRGGPEPDKITFETFRREIPEA